jgi:poly(glycerol-phosphate) alpha-glucosyltransferase
MRTGVVTASVSRRAGGFFHSVRRLHQSLAQLPDVKTEVLTVRDEFTDADISLWQPLPVRVFPYRGPRQFGYSPMMATALAASGVDLVHSHGIWMYPSVAVNAWHRRTQGPHVISPRGMMDAWALENSRWRKRIAGWLFENANLRTAACLHALCASEAQAIRAYGLTNPIAVIPNGIDPPQLDPSASSPVGKPENREWQRGRKVLLYLGRLHPKKGLVNLLRAWKVVLSSHPSALNNWILAIAGWDQGGHEAELKRLADELGLGWMDVRARGRADDERTGTSEEEAASLVFLGPQFDSAKAASYRLCDAFVLPSLSEGLPMVVLEAWSYGKPVLMTPECNLPEGFASNAAIRIEHNVKSIEEGIRTLLSAQPSSLQVLGDNARRLVSSRFTWPIIASNMFCVYRWLLEGGSRPDCVLTA